MKKQPPPPSVEISPVAVPDKSWSFRYNDERVTYEQYMQIQQDHSQWVKDSSSKKAKEEEVIPPKKTRKKTSSKASYKKMR